MVRISDGSSGRALSTIKRRLSTLSGFYAYLVATDRLERSPVLPASPRERRSPGVAEGFRWCARPDCCPEPAEVSALLGALRRAAETPCATSPPPWSPKPACAGSRACTGTTSRATSSDWHSTRRDGTRPSRPGPSAMAWACCGCSSSGSSTGDGTTPPSPPILQADLPRVDDPLPRFLDDAEAAVFCGWASCAPWRATLWCSSVPPTGCACRSASSATTATCRCTRCWSNFSTAGGPITPTTPC